MAKYTDKEIEQRAGKRLKNLGKKRPSVGLSTKQKSTVVSKAKKGGDIGKKGKHFAEIAAKAAKKYGSEEKGRAVAAAAMWRNIKR